MTELIVNEFSSGFSSTALPVIRTVSSCDGGRLTGPRHRHLKDLIEASVVFTFGVGSSELQRPTRGSQRVALARQVAMYVAHTICRLSLTEVGLLFARDRTTVAHACCVVEDRRDDDNFDYMMELLERIVLSYCQPRAVKIVI